MTICCVGIYHLMPFVLHKAQNSASPCLRLLFSPLISDACCVSYLAYTIAGGAHLFTFLVPFLPYQPVIACVSSEQVWSLRLQQQSLKVCE